MDNIKLLDCNTCAKKDVCKIYDDIIDIPPASHDTFIEAYDLDLKVPQNKIKDILKKNSVISKYKYLDIVVTCEQYESINTHTYCPKTNLLDG